MSQSLEKHRYTYKNRNSQIRDREGKNNVPNTNFAFTMPGYNSGELFKSPTKKQINNELNNETALLIQQYENALRIMNKNEQNEMSRIYKKNFQKQKMSQRVKTSNGLSRLSTKPNTHSKSHHRNTIRQKKINETKKKISTLIKIFKTQVKQLTSKLKKIDPKQNNSISELSKSIEHINKLKI
mgnify:CR=1 FL=1|tara:strand:- start:413 stop:961 length:549 start_codon:yes stop_codon:yes gene_type:complete